MSNSNFNRLKRSAAEKAEEKYGEYLMRQFGHADLMKISPSQGVDALLVFIESFQEEMDAVLENEAPF